jgi:hypothetical protein
MGAPAHPASAIACPDVPAALEVAQGGHAGLDDEDHAAAVAAIATVGAATRNMGLAAERAGTVAARPARDVDPGAISEHRRQDTPGKLRNIYG